MKKATLQMWIHEYEYTVRVKADGDKFWWLNGKLHREDGPAVEYADGGKSWYLNGKWVTEEEHKRMTYQIQRMTYQIHSEGKRVKNYATLGKIFGMLLGTVISVSLSVAWAVITLEMMGVQLR